MIHEHGKIRVPSKSSFDVVALAFVCYQQTPSHLVQDDVGEDGVAACILISTGWHSVYDP